MPTYEYECTKCGKQWELFQSIKAEPERTCPKCGRATARRKIGIGAAILSGGRGGDAAEAPAAASTAGTASAAKDAATKPSTGASKPGATPAAPTPAPAAKAADEGKLNSTHPARDGRGAGNLRDAIARQRAAGAKKSGNSGLKKAAKTARRGAK